MRIVFGNHEFESLWNRTTEAFPFPAPCSCDPRVAALPAACGRCRGGGVSLSNARRSSATLVHVAQTRSSSTQARVSPIGTGEMDVAVPRLRVETAPAHRHSEVWRRGSRQSDVLRPAAHTALRERVCRVGLANSGYPDSRKDPLHHVRLIYMSERHLFLSSPKHRRQRR